MEQVIDQSEGDRPIIISGLRGVGKTVLLNEFVRNAQQSRRWITIKLEAVAGASLKKTLTLAIFAELRKAMSADHVVKEKLKRFASVFRSFQMKVDPAGSYSFGFTVDAAEGVADSGEFDRDLFDLLSEIGDAARTLGRGVLLAVDELQDAPRADLNGLNVALHHLGQAAWPVPVSFIGTGLPSLPSVLADATSYAERLYDYRTLGLLSEEETVDALTRPAEARDVMWDKGAVQLTLDAVGGYPYFVQACGKHIWDVRASPDEITIEDARVGVTLAREEVDRGLYQSRWDRATPAQREMMRAMADDNDAPSAIQDLVARTGKTRTSDLSVSRRELISNGHIYAPDRGFLAFTVPGMADFIHRRINE